MLYFFSFKLRPWHLLVTSGSHGPLQRVWDSLRSPEFPSVISYRMSDYFLNEEDEEEEEGKRRNKKNLFMLKFVYASAFDSKLDWIYVLLLHFDVHFVVLVGVFFCPLNYSFWMCNEIEHAIFMLYFQNKKPFVDYFQYFGWFFFTFIWPIPVFELF